MTWWEAHIVTDQEILGGKPCIKGTRIPVALIVEALRVDNWGLVLIEFPALKVDDLMAALMFDIERIKGEKR